MIYGPYVESRSYISNRHLLPSIKDLCCFGMVFICHDEESTYAGEGTCGDGGIFRGWAEE